MIRCMYCKSSVSPVLYTKVGDATSIFLDKECCSLTKDHFLILMVKHGTGISPFCDNHGGLHDGLENRRELVYKELIFDNDDV